MNRKVFITTLGIVLMIVLGSAPVAAADNSPSAYLLAAGLEGGSGSAIGPDGAIYATEGILGRITRIDPITGNMTTFASGLPQQVIPLGGAIDIAFLDGTAYVLVTAVSPDVFGLGSHVSGIYRMDGPTIWTVIADLGQWSIENPSDSDVFIPSGVHFAIDTFRGGFLVTDGHHNRVLYATLDGDVSEMKAFGNIVPTGLEVWGQKVLVAEAGPNPHLPLDGKIVAFNANSSSAAWEIAAGAPLLVDVEFGLGRTLYGLAQGIFPVGNPDGSPAMPNTGSLVEVKEDGTFSTVIDGLNQPTSLEFIGGTAYIVTLGGEVWKIDGILNPPNGK